MPSANVKHVVFGTLGLLMLQFCFDAEWVVEAVIAMVPYLFIQILPTKHVGWISMILLITALGVVHFVSMTVNPLFKILDIANAAMVRVLSHDS